MRRWFESRNRREQVLVTVFVMMVALTWFFSALGRMRTRLDDWRSTRAGLAAQQLWLDRQADIEARSAAAVRNLDPAKTHDATRLSGAVNSLATGAGLSPSIDPPQTQRTPQFAHHTIKVTFRRANLPALLSFYDELAKQAPYLNLEAIALQTDRSAAGALNATLQISATQIVKSSN
jgi:hypothetical protein